MTGINDENMKKEYGDCYGCGHHRQNCRLCRVSGQGIFVAVKDCKWRYYPWKGYHPDYIKDEEKEKQ